MQSTGPQSTVTNAPQNGQSVAQGCAGTHVAHLLRSPQHRGRNSRRQPPSPVKDVVLFGNESKDPQRCAVHRIPPEILGIIFANCLDEQAPSRAIVSKPPLLLGRVCSYWRSVAQSTPRIWTSLSLRFLETNLDRSRDSAIVAVAVETWLHRSHPAPLSIAFIDNRIFQKDTEDVVIWLLSCICTHAPRWKGIHLKFSSDYFIRLAVLSSCAFTSLTSFSVHIDHMGWRRGLLSLHLDLSQASRLTSLAYTGPGHVNREEIIVDWARLTSVALSYDLHEAGGESATLPCHFSTLALCQNLTELSIGLSTPLAQHFHPHEASQGQAVIELPRVHTLRVRRLSWSAHTCAFVDALRLPQLSTLVIDGAVLAGWGGSRTPFWHPDSLSNTQIHTQTHWWHAHHFSALLDRSACHLHTLRIRDVDMSPAELARLLTSQSTSPTLSTFTFEPFPRGCPILDMLGHLVVVPSPRSTPSVPSPGLTSSTGQESAISPNSSLNAPSTPFPTVLPALTKLRLGCAHESHLDTLGDIIESRTGERATEAGVRPLATFELVFYDFVYRHGQGRQPWRKWCFDAFKERVLRCAREGGVDVDIQVERPYEPVYLPVP